jgi:hypothetical protein
MKSFWHAVESLDQQRIKLWAQFRREFQITYGKRLEDNKQLFDRYYKMFAERPVEELNYYLNQIKGQARQEFKRDQEYKAKQERLKFKQNRRALQTAKGTYMRVEDDTERVVCSDEDPGFDKTGMPCFVGDHSGSDPELRGYFAIHVGSAREWIPILLRDGYCDGTHAYIYTIKTSELARTKTPFYTFGDDYHISDKTDTPSSEIIFSKLDLIPPQYIVLEEVIDLQGIEPAPDIY